MSSYDLPQSVSVDLFSNQVNIVNNLWSVYVAATFAAAGFGTTLDAKSLAARVAITLGFWAFTLGHLHLLRQGLSILQSLSRAITNITQKAGNALSNEFADVLTVLAKTANRPSTATAIHLFIDICVTIAIWAPYFLK
jgi:hypothetical protein